MKNLQQHNTANAEKWNRRAVTFDQKRFDIFRYLQWELIRYARIQSPCNFLDIGCGTGWAVRYIANRLNGNGRFVGIDISKGMIERARRHAAGLQNVEFYEGSAEKLPVESASFDTVICSNSFHHYFQPVEALKEMRRILHPHGKLFILDLTADDFFFRWVDERTRIKEKEHVKFIAAPNFNICSRLPGIRHIRSVTLKILYPLKVHIGEKVLER